MKWELREAERKLREAYKRDKFYAGDVKIKDKRVVPGEPRYSVEELQKLCAFYLLDNFGKAMEKKPNTRSANGFVDFMKDNPEKVKQILEGH